MKIATQISFLSISSILLFALVDQCHAFTPSNSFGHRLIAPAPYRSNDELFYSSKQGSISCSRSNTVLSMQSEDENDSSISASFTSPLSRPVLAVVDLLSLLLFAGIGKASHTTTGSLDPGAVLITAFPFVAAWFVTSPFTGVYNEDDRTENMVKEAFLKAGKGWIVAVPLGCILRGVIKGYIPPLPFVVVTMIATLVIIGGARALFSAAEDFFVEFV